MADLATSNSSTMRHMPAQASFLDNGRCRCASSGRRKIAIGVAEGYTASSNWTCDLELSAYHPGPTSPQKAADVLRAEWWEDAHLSDCSNGSRLAAADWPAEPDSIACAGTCADMKTYIQA